MKYIYVLQLVNGYWYIGKSERPILRVLNHFHNDKTTAWIGMHGVERVNKVFESSGDFDEDVCVLEYMKKYGIDKVRGGSFSQIFLDEHARHFIERLIRSTEDRCYECGEIGHYCATCPFKNTQRSLSGKL